MQLWLQLRLQQQLRLHPDSLLLKICPYYE